MRNININEAILSYYSRGNRFKSLHIYSVMQYLTAGYGYRDSKTLLQEMCDLLGISPKTAKRWLYIVHQANFVNIKKGVIYVKGRKKIEQPHNTTQTYVKFYLEDLKSYSNFQAHTIRQVALLLQRRFSYAWKSLNSENPTSLVTTGKIETTLAVVKTRARVGCSLSQIQKKLGFDKMTISKALKGYAKKQYNRSLPIKGTIVRVKYGDFLNVLAGNKRHSYEGPDGQPIRYTRNRGDIPYKWGFEYLKATDEYILIYAIASLIVVESSLCRKR